jgi:beta-glucanase (GH16 family)
MTSFFTYTNSPQHDEIDIEFRGSDTNFMWTNFFFNGNFTNHEAQFYLGFDAAEDFHRYKFVWSASEIKWYVDGQWKRTAMHSASDPLPIFPGKIMVNLWSARATATWLGAFTYPGTPVYAEYDWIRYKQP